MIDYTYASLFDESSVDKQLTLTFSGGEVVTNENIYSESMEITESICSEEQLTFGACEASQFKIKIANSFDSHIGQELTVTVTLAGGEDEPFTLGTYTVTSDKPTSDRRYREITAYDKMYDIINADVVDWYDEILPDTDSTVTMKDFRASFASHFGLEEEDIDLVNDDMTVEKTVSASSLSGKDVLSAICELNGCFAHITRTNTITYITLSPITEESSCLVGYAYTSISFTDVNIDSDDGYITALSDSYRECTYEDFTTEYIDCIQIRQEENDVGCIYGDGEDNAYIIQGNFLVYGKDTEELEEIASNLYEVICAVSYRPAEITSRGNPCIEVGDGVLLETKYQEIRTYVLSRTLSGIQALQDKYTADGEEVLSEDLNGTQNSIEQLKGKTNILERTVEETISQISDVEESLSSTIKQTASEILSEVAGSSDTWDKSGYPDAITSYGEPAAAGYDASEYSGQYYIDQSTGYVYLSDGESWSKVDELQEMTVTIQALISTSISDSETKITSSITESYENYVTDALGYYSTTTVIKNYIEQTVSYSENSIKEYVSENYTTQDDVEETISAELVLEIETDDSGNKYGKISANADYIEFNAGDIVINSDNFTLDADGNATFSGELSAATGTFAGSIEAEEVYIHSGEGDAYQCTLKMTQADGLYISSLYDPSLWADSEYDPETAIRHSYAYFQTSGITLAYQGDKTLNNDAYLIINSEEFILEPSSNSYYVTVKGDLGISGGVYCQETLKNDGTSTLTGTVTTGANIAAGTNLRIGNNDTSGTTEYSINTYWKDGSLHNLVTRNSDGLTCAFGWIGSSSYSTVTIIRGQAVKYTNSSGTTSLSDERLKTDWRDLGVYEEFFDELNPQAFKYINGASGRYHLGFSAQAIEQALANTGLSTSDFAGFIEMAVSPDSEDYNGYETEYGLIYTEFIALLTDQIQKLKSRVTELETAIS